MSRSPAFGGVSRPAVVGLHAAGRRREIGTNCAVPIHSLPTHAICTTVVTESPARSAAAYWSFSFTHSLYYFLSLSPPARVCHIWLTNSFCSSGSLTSCRSSETAVVNRLKRELCMYVLGLSSLPYSVSDLPLSTIYDFTYRFGLSSRVVGRF